MSLDILRTLCLCVHGGDLPPSWPCGRCETWCFRV